MLADCRARNEMLELANLVTVFSHLELGISVELRLHRMTTFETHENFLQSTLDEAQFKQTHDGRMPGRS